MGHADAWNYTLRELAGWSYFTQRRRRLEMAETLSIQAAAARGEGKDLKKMHRDLTKDD